MAPGRHHPKKPNPDKPSPNEQGVSVDGHRFILTNLDKVLYPETGTTKGEVLHYYAKIAPFLIPHAADRPATRKRWVNGVGTNIKPGKSFFNKDLDAGTPSWIRHYAIEHSDHTNDYPLINDLATLTWFAQLASLEFHVPQWKFGRGGKQRNPDRFVLDLDPGEDAGLPECIEVAKLARRILLDMGLEPVPVTSGSKGIHVYAALDGKQTAQEVTDVAHELARALEADNRSLVVSDMKKELRGGKVLVDWSQNNGSKTTIAPYSLRGRTHPMVAVPRTWRELDGTLAQLDLGEVLDRMKHRKDPLTALLGKTAGGILDADELADPDRLTTYRRMRDRSKTSEPVPAEAPKAGEGKSFVIQEHHARRLHYDFRLEHDGVLVSWALPKGVPTDPKRNRLAVQTEDHPLEYGTFEGTIPKGEYGAGAVSICDAGEYELDKWRDGEEVIVTLPGKNGGGLDGPRKYALIHTGGEGKENAHWLIHLMGGAAKTTSPPENARKTGPRRVKTISPMLATLGGEADLGSGDDGEDWAYEMKWDGIRAIVHIDGPEVRLMSRNGNDLTAAYPDLAEELAEVVDAKSAILDGEIVALDKQSRPSFSLLQRRMGLTKKHEVEQAAKEVPVHLMLFDVLDLNGMSQRKESYDTRRGVLRSIVTDPDEGRVLVPPAFDGDFAAAFKSSSDLGLEGVVAKKRDGTYTLGRRSRTWIKVKHNRTQDVVIGGWRPGKGRRADGIGSLLLGIPGEDGTLDYIGRVGTGFVDEELKMMKTRLDKIPRKTSPFGEVPRADSSDAHWVSPRLVGEVKFTEWTSTNRLRHPSWRGRREDKSAGDVRKGS
ncbi:MAG: ATP-dependent DNA ligase [Kineosporiaceae bacterium]|nr:ATP-dependent DNA ligase [Aeromicrobium sp.]